MGRRVDDGKLGVWAGRQAGVNVDVRFVGVSLSDGRAGRWSLLDMRRRSDDDEVQVAGQCHLMNLCWRLFEVAESKFETQRRQERLLWDLLIYFNNNGLSLSLAKREVLSNVSKEVTHTGRRIECM